MRVEDIYQIGISLFGVAGFLFVLRDDRKWQIAGVVCGLCANPFWWTMWYIEEQWIMTPVHALYTYGWYNKGWRLWKARNER